MQERHFETDISREKTPVMNRLALETVLWAFVFLAVFGLFAGGKLAPDGMTWSLLIFAAIWTVVVVLKIIRYVRGFKNALRTAEHTSEGITINGTRYRADLEHGLGLQVRIHEIFFFDTGGASLIVKGTGDNGEPLRAEYWLGPLKNGYCAGKTQEFFGMLNATITERRALLFQEFISSGDPIRIKVDRDRERNRLYLLSSAASAAGVLMTAAGAYLFWNSGSGNRTLFVAGFIIMTGGILLAAKAVPVLVSRIVNQKTAVTEMEVSRSAVTVNGDVYETGEGFSCTAKGTPKKAAGRRKTDAGYYLTVKDAQHEKRYWIGPEADSQAALVITAADMAERITKAEG